MNNKVSVIIPVYNVNPEFIKESLNSVLESTYQNLEVIVVNDGSTKQETVAYLNSIKNESVRLVNQDNKGLAEARNTGIRNASGVYILPLDADDLIDKTYIEKAVKAIDGDPQIGIVYCKADFIGKMTGEWELPDFKMPDFLLFNSIFCTALFRKNDWEKAGGYKKEMCYGWEDYEFWLSLIENGAVVYKIPEVLFHYRKHGTSMISGMAYNKAKYSRKLIKRFHQGLYQKYHSEIARHTRNSWLQNIFSIRNSKSESCKIITLFGYKIKMLKSL